MKSKTITVRLNEEEQKWLEDVKTEIIYTNKIPLNTSEIIKCLIWNYWDEYCNPVKYLSNKSDSS